MTSGKFRRETLGEFPKKKKTHKRFPHIPSAGFSRKKNSWMISKGTFEEFQQAAPAGFSEVWDDSQKEEHSDDFQNKFREHCHRELLMDFSDSIPSRGNFWSFPKKAQPEY